MANRTPNAICIQCGKGFYNRPSTPNRKTCSKECNSLARKAGKIKSGATAKKNCTCSYCGEKFYRSPSHQKRSKSGDLFCSSKCFGLSQRNKITKECEWCGVSFETIPAKKDSHRFCSYDCKQQALWESNDTREEVECVICGETFLARLNTNRKYCSRKCMGIGSSEKFLNPEYAKQWGAKFVKSPNKLENFFNENTPDNISFVGDGKLWIKLSTGKVKNPDFIITGQNKVIELYGDYWHKGDNTEELINHYKEVGYDCLVLWESEIKQNWETTLQKVLQFIETA